MRNINKKGQSLGGLYSGVTVLAACGLLLVILLYVYSNIGTSIGGVTAGVYNNQTYTVTGTGSVLTAATNGMYPETANFVITGVTNRTSGVLVPSSNYSVTSSGLFNISQGLPYYQGFPVNITYTFTYTQPNSAYNGTQTLTTQFVNFLPWIGIILLVMGAGAVLFFVIRSFSGAGQKGI